MRWWGQRETRQLARRVGLGWVELAHVAKAYREAWYWPETRSRLSQILL